jgi:glycosyltransferase involved in cell wall biosynthesis
MRCPDIAVLVSTYQRAQHLRKCLISLACQQGVHGRFEVIVTDDGSCDETESVVDEFARDADIPVKFTTHAHHDFQLGRCRNEGVAATQSPYLLFTDGDCVLPPDHLRHHLAFRRPRVVIAGDCYRLDQATSDRVTVESIRNGTCFQSVATRERLRLMMKGVRAWGYYYLRKPLLPRLTGNNIGVWREDFEAVNGFDENFVGWGLEDRDLQRRLWQTGVRCMSILGYTATCHLWHPTVPSFSRNGVGTRNLAYFQRPHVETRCRNGLAERKLALESESMQTQQPSSRVTRVFESRRVA